jgi:hypothetical protein
MIVTIWILSCLFAYAFVAGASAARHHAKQREIYDHGANYCFNGRWCGHAYRSFWLAGVLWPGSLPVVLGMKTAGDSDRLSRTERRRKSEIDEANHRVRLAEIRAKETEALERALEQQ